MIWKRKRLPKERLPVLIANGFSIIPMFGFPTEKCVSVYKNKGHRVRKVTWSLEAMKDTEEYSESIKEEVLRMIDGSNHRKINLIGWSMGGIACLHALKRRGLHCLVDTMITVFSPFRGANLAYTGMASGVFMKVGVQLRPNSPFLDDLMKDGLPGDTKYVSIIGQKDAICPVDSAILPGAKNVRTGFCHHDFFANAKLHKVVVAQMRA